MPIMLALRMAGFTIVEKQINRPTRTTERYIYLLYRVIVVGRRLKMDLLWTYHRPTIKIALSILATAVKLFGYSRKVFWLQP